MMDNDAGAAAAGVNDGAGSDANAGAGDDNSAAGANAGASAAEIYRPEGLTDGLLGATDRETIDKLVKAFNDNRAAANERGTVPKAADKYTLPETLPDGMSPDVQQFLGELNDDPAFHAMRTVLHEAGVTDKQFAQIVPGVFAAMLDGELMEPLLDPVKERQLLVPDELANASVEDQGKAVDKRLNDNRGWLKALGGEEGKGLDEEAIKAVEQSLLDSAAGNRAIEFFRGMQAGSVDPATGGQGGGGVTEADLQKMAADPRADPSSAKYDPKFEATVNEAYKKFYGT